MRDRAVDQVSYVFLAAHVSKYELGLNTERSQLRHEFPTGVVVPPRDDGPRPLAGEGERRGASDTR
jgi:hypothetical protein